MRRLRASALQTLVVRPTPFFSDMAEVLRMAHKSRVFVVGMEAAESIRCPGGISRRHPSMHCSQLNPNWTSEVRKSLP